MCAVAVGRFQIKKLNTVQWNENKIILSYLPVYKKDKKFRNNDIFGLFYG